MQEQLWGVDELSGHGAPVSLTQQKEVAEQAVAALLQEARTSIEHKLQLTQKRHQQKASISSSMRSAKQQFAHVPSSSSASEALPIADIRSYNESQLQASLTLFTAFDETKKARDHLQQCLEREKALLTSLEAPLQQGLAQSVQLVQHVADALETEDPLRELRHTEMMLRLCQLLMPSSPLHCMFEASTAICGLSTFCSTLTCSYVNTCCTAGMNQWC